MFNYIFAYDDPGDDCPTHGPYADDDCPRCDDDDYDYDDDWD
ncbi:MAG: hypothetical protein GFH27_549321n144 [Chloroflexi bacterium AL-W]|nr:hypothetical protein [Chloroflexi bacterium AL-N1]NOK65021.1 hypothetical protein [Chloroflexi bacterium AL-N10]NOK76791.1 hypothetical protein [Chloroflexi bacterium AL-N5]NOK84683.1 hypothetical protein [Chloroflexi bacterium AL-W]NOK86492.1 hypothetical protein [Chloroflexi bacterium AL-N15]